MVVSLRTELAVRTESFMGIGDEQGSKQLKLAPKILKGYICNPYGLEGYVIGYASNPLNIDDPSVAVG